MIYIHIPFCRTFCTYCGFYSELLCRNGVVSPEDFVSALKAELQSRIPGNASNPKTLYIGGGTPSALPFSVLCIIAEAVKDATGLRSFDEFTVEVNPDDIVRGGHEYVEGLLAAGVNRISMGVQSFDDGILRWMNRRHDAAEAVRAYRILRESGVGNVSVDLIFGLSQLGDGLWRETIDKTLSLPYAPPEHVSAYQLSVERGSALEKMIDRGLYAEASEEQCCRHYMLLCSMLADAGYHHYEVSNFAFSGREAVHNSAYWSGCPYIGLGPGAHSYCIRDGVHVRSWNISSVDAYVVALKSGKPDSVVESETLTPEQDRLEKVMLSLRTSCGLPEQYLRQTCGDTSVDRELSAGNLIRYGDGNVRIPEERFFVSDMIVAGLV